MGDSDQSSEGHTVARQADSNEGYQGVSGGNWRPFMLLFVKKENPPFAEIIITLGGVALEEL